MKARIIAAGVTRPNKHFVRTVKAHPEHNPHSLPVPVGEVIDHPDCWKLCFAKTVDGVIMAEPADDECAQQVLAEAERVRKFREAMKSEQARAAQLQLERAKINVAKAQAAARAASGSPAAAAEPKSDLQAQAAQQAREAVEAAGLDEVPEPKKKK